MESLGMRDKVIATFLGVAIGDALGMSVEYMKKEEIVDHLRKRGISGRLENYLRPDGHKWFDGRGPGEWTDDWFFTGLIAESLIAKGKIDMDDIAKRHADAYRQGDLEKYGSGKTTREALRNLAEGKHWSESGIPGGAGNGVVMKINPVMIFRILPLIKILFKESAADAEEELDEYIEKEYEEYVQNLINLTFMTHKSGLALVSALVHGTALFVCLLPEEYRNKFMKDNGSDDATFQEMFVGLIGLSMHNTLRSGPKNISDAMEIEPGSEPLSKKLHFLFLGHCDPDQKKEFSDEEIIKMCNGGRAYVADSQSMSYAFFLRKPNSIEALYDVVNAGGDTDTNGSIVASLLGALNGTKIFPKHLIDGLWRKDEILKIANDFCDKFGIED